MVINLSLCGRIERKKDDAVREVKAIRGRGKKSGKKKTVNRGEKVFVLFGE